jgi:hypothetical protein
MWHMRNIIRRSLSLMKKKWALQSGLTLESQSSTHMILMKLNVTRFSIYSCRRSRSIYLPATDCHQPKNSRRRSGASGTMPIHITPMNVGHSNDKSRWPSSKGRIQWKEPEKPMKVDGNPFPEKLMKVDGRNIKRNRKGGKEPIKGSGSTPIGIVPSSSTAGNRE